MRGGPEGDPCKRAAAPPHGPGRYGLRAAALCGLTVVLFASLAPRLLPGPAPYGWPERALTDRAVDSLIGFVMARDRLPCPDVDGDGLEDCNVLAARPLGGGFPFRTLGWVEWPPAPSESRFRYAVYRGEVDLAVAGARSDPVWPPGVPAGLQRRGAVQFCEALHALSRASGPALQVRSGTPAQAPVAVAFALSGVDPSAGAIDGRLEGGGFGPDGSDSRLLPFGFLELGDQLGCREVLSSVLPAMREAALAHALWRAAASRVPAHEAPAAAAAYRDAALRQALLREDRAWLQ